MEGDLIFGYLFRAIVVTLVGGVIWNIRSFRQELKQFNTSLSEVTYDLREVLKDLKHNEKELRAIEDKDKEQDLAIDVIKDRILVLEIAIKGNNRGD